MKGASAMTSTASHDSVDPAGQQVRRPDELEHWLTDLRVDLSEDNQAWLRPVGDTDSGELSIVPHLAEDHSRRKPGTTASSTDPSRSMEGDPPRPAAGRHRAAD
jgi:hypothetical protein